MSLQAACKGMGIQDTQSNAVSHSFIHWGWAGTSTAIGTLLIETPPTQSKWRGALTKSLPFLCVIYPKPLYTKQPLLAPMSQHAGNVHLVFSFYFFVGMHA